MYEHDEIQECVVAGIPDPYRGETVKAYIVLKEGYSITEDELNKYCRQHLAAFKVPRSTSSAMNYRKRQSAKFYVVL